MKKSPRQHQRSPETFLLKGVMMMMLMLMLMSSVVNGFTILPSSSPTLSPSSSSSRVIHRHGQQLYATEEQPSSSSFNSADDDNNNRKDLLRMLEKTYYNSNSNIVDEEQPSNEKSGGATSTTGDAQQPILSPQHGLYQDLPIWRDDYTELPGFQHQWNNITNPHFIDLLKEVVSSKPGVGPWYYGHLLIPGGPTNIDDPTMKLSIAGSNAPMTGTLMKISDYHIDNITGGKWTVVVQALGRFFVSGNVIRHGSPFAIATVEMLPDEELIEAQYLEAKEVMMEQKSTTTTTDFTTTGNGNGNENEKEYHNARGAACVAAVEEGAQWHEYEFQRVDWDKSVVAPVSNFNIYAGNSTRMQNVSNAVHTVIEDYFHQSPLEIYESECSLGDDFFDDLDDEDCDIDDETCETPESLVDTALQEEYEVWIELDKFARMTSKLGENTDPVYPLPAQILGLLPRPQSPIQRWPKFFTLSKFARKLDRIKTLLKNEETKLQSVEGYPAVRRCRRLSYVVWALFEKFDARLDDNDNNNEEEEEEEITKLFDPTVLRFYTNKKLTKQDILEMDSVAERLRAAKSKLQRINKLLLKSFD